MRPLPDLAICEILQFLPSKDAVRLSFLSKHHQGAWVLLLPVICFIEPGQLDDAANGQDRHIQFINVLNRYLECRLKQARQNHDTLHTIRLRMLRYDFTRDATIVDKLLAFSFDRGVKELDISLKNNNRTQISYDFRHGVLFCYSISKKTFVNTRSITTLNLEYVRMKRIDRGTTGMKLLPCLKTMSLKDVHFETEALYLLVCECPSINYLSLASCCFDDLHKVQISNSSLKILQFKSCNVSALEILGVTNLESFSFVSSKFMHDIITLKNSINLKHVQVRARHLKRFFLWVCHENLQGIFNTPDLNLFHTVGHLKTKYYVEGPIVAVAITLWDLGGRELFTLDGGWEHFSALRNFLTQFCCPRKLILYIRNYKALIFPENFINAFPSPIFPTVEWVELRMSNFLNTSNVRDIAHHLRVPKKPKVTEIFDLSNSRNASEMDSDLLNSLLWLAPSLSRTTIVHTEHSSKRKSNT